MGLLSRLLGRRGGAASGAPEPAAHAQPAREAQPVAYDPALIARLKADHRELQRALAAALRAAEEGRFHDIHHLLSHFQQRLQAHVATENARFYPCLQQTVAGDAQAASLVAGARREMNALTFEVQKVVDAYLAYPPTHLTETQFTYDLQQASAQLAKRVEQAEARLYSLYRP
jgi:hypothetical protein